MMAGVAPARAQVQDQGTQSPSPSAPIPAQGSTTQGPNTGKPPAGVARGVSGPNNGEPYDPAQSTADTNTLAGAQQFGLGSLERPHNIFDPSLSASELGVTTSDSSGKLQLTSETIVGGSLNFNRYWNRYHFTAIYSGGESFFRGQNIGGTPDSPFHDLTLMQEIDWARWHILLRDDFVASPGAAFTGTGMGGPGLISQISSTIEASLNSVGQGFIPGETIQNGNAMRYRNATLGQVEYFFNRKSSVTVAGSYGLLDFPGTGYINSHMTTAQAGYEFAFDPNNSIGILGAYSRINYSEAAVSATSTTSYLAALAYGWKITGRLALQVFGGPDITTFSVPIGTTTREVSGSGGASLSYAISRGSLGLSYNHGVTAGSGVYAGSETDQVTGSIGRNLTRVWSAHANIGFAKNRSIVGSAAQNSFDSVTVSGGVNRSFGPNTNFSLAYTANLQTSGAPAGCTGANCSSAYTQHQITMNFQWHARPLVLR